MRPETGDASYLWDMLDAACAIRQFAIGKSFNDYTHDRLLRGAIERHIEIIGEAARNISQPYRDAHPEIPWKKSSRSVMSSRTNTAKSDRADDPRKGETGDGRDQ